MSNKKRSMVPEHRIFNGKKYKLSIILGNKRNAEQMIAKMRNPNTLVRLVKYPSSYITPLGTHPKYNPGGYGSGGLNKTFFCIYIRYKSYRTYEDEDRAWLLWQRRQGK